MLYDKLFIRYAYLNLLKGMAKSKEEKRNLIIKAYNMLCLYPSASFSFGKKFNEFFDKYSLRKS